MNLIKTTLLAGIAALSLPGAANAVQIVIGDTSGNNQTDVEGTMDFSVTTVGLGTYKFAFTLENTSNLGTTRLTGVAFDLLAGAAQTGHTAPAGWGYEADTGTLPGENGAFDACFYSGANCGAGAKANSGLSESDAALGGFSVTFTLGGGLTAQQVQDAFMSGFDDKSLKVCVRVVSIPKTSGNGAGSDVACYENGGGDEKVPEPGTLALLGLGLLGLGLSRQRQVGGNR